MNFVKKTVQIFCVNNLSCRRVGKKKEKKKRHYFPQGGGDPVNFVKSSLNFLCQILFLTDQIRFQMYLGIVPKG